MSYSFMPPCNNYPSPGPEGQSDCIKKDTCADRHLINGAICAIHQMGKPHQGGGSIVLNCSNKVVAEPETEPEAYKKRVIAEKTDLDEKLTKLIAFTGSPKFSALDEDSQDRLKRQSAIMTDYSVVLGERIAAF